MSAVLAKKIIPGQFATEPGEPKIFYAHVVHAVEQAT